MRTTDAMTTDEAAAAANGWTLVQWDAAYEAACDSVMDEYASRIGLDADDTDAQNAANDAVNDATTNAWTDGMSHDEWVSAALRALPR